MLWYLYGLRLNMVNGTRIYMVYTPYIYAYTEIPYTVLANPIHETCTWL